jgi:hypothetical protein
MLSPNKKSESISVSLIITLLACLPWSMHAVAIERSGNCRRDILRSIGTFSLGLVSLDFADLLHPSDASAACLPGDLSPDCIGVYKVPIDENILPYTGTKSALKSSAPDIRFVPPVATPKSTKEALQWLQTQRLAADDIAQVVTSGRLEEAGIKVLNLLPKVTVASRALVEAKAGGIAKQGESETIRELRRQKLQSLNEQVYVLWNSVDIAIGQGIRGEMGAPVVAQLMVLDVLKDAIRSLDDLLAALT